MEIDTEPSLGKRPRTQTTNAIDEVNPLSISNSGLPTTIRPRKQNNLPLHILRNDHRLQEDNNLTGAYWKEGATENETGYYAVLRASETEYCEGRIEYIKLGTKYDWYRLI